MNQKFVDGVCVLCSVLTVFLWTFVLAGVLLAPGCTLLDDDPSNDPSPQQIATVIQSGARAVTGIALSQVDADERVEIALEVKDRAGQVQYYLNAVLDNGSPATAAIDILRKNFIRLLPPDLQVYVLTGLDSLIIYLDDTGLDSPLGNDGLLYVNAFLNGIIEGAAPYTLAEGGNSSTARMVQVRTVNPNDYRFIEVPDGFEILSVSVNQAQTVVTLVEETSKGKKYIVDVYYSGLLKGRYLLTK